MQAAATGKGVPSTWVHPDLRKQMLERISTGTARRIEKLEEDCEHVSDYTKRIEVSLSDKKQRFQKLQHTLQTLATEVEVGTQQCSEAHRLQDTLTSQIYFQKSIIPHSLTSVKESLLGQVLARREYLGNDFRSIEMPFSALSQCIAFFGQALVCEVSEDETGNASIQAFLAQCAPLFEWNSESHTVGLPFFFDEPCLMAANGQLTCGNPACAYWHKDQCEHMKMCCRMLVARGALLFSRDHRLCAVSEFFLTFAQHAECLDTVESLCRRMAYTLNYVVALGWHGGFLSTESPQSSPSRTAACCWPAPVALLTSSSVPPLRLLLRDAEEKAAWEWMQRAGSATDFFTARQDALAWRCVIFFTPTTASEQRLWLAERGAALFPSSPHLQLHCVFTLIDLDTPVVVCASRCLEAAEILATQVCAAAYAGASTHCSYTDGAVFYAETVPRYIAYMIARAVVYCAAKGDRQQTTALLSRVLEKGSGSYGLLPMASHNLSLMLAVAREGGDLTGMADLPLGCISDMTFTLRRPCTPYTNGACAEILQQQLHMTHAYERDLLSPSLVDELVAATRLALMRTSSATLSCSTSIPTPLSTHEQTLLWVEWIHLVATAHGIPAAASTVCDLLKAECAHDATTICAPLMLFMCCFLAAFRPDQRHLAQEAASRCCGHAKSEHTNRGADGQTSLGVEEFLTPLDGVTANLLSAMLEHAPQEQSERLGSSCVLSYASDATATQLLMLAQCRLAAIAEDESAFRATLTQNLQVAREAHLLLWSPLDTWHSKVVGAPHYMALTVYQQVPSLLGSKIHLTRQWRIAVLEVASALAVLHPVLREQQQQSPA